MEAPMPADWRCIFSSWALAETGATSPALVGAGAGAASGLGAEAMISCRLAPVGVHGFL